MKLGGPIKYGLTAKVAFLHCCIAIDKYKLLLLFYDDRNSRARAVRLHDNVSLHIPAVEYRVGSCFSDDGGALVEDGQSEIS